MSRTLPWTILVGLTSVLVCVSASQPQFLDDRNSFMKGFVTHELLATLGIMLTVTLASTATLHLELNKLQQLTQDKFEKTRSAIRLSAYSLIACFVLATVLVVVKPMCGQYGILVALLNSFSLIILYFTISVLYDLTRAAFKIPAISDVSD